MRTGGAMLLIAVGLIALWIVVTGRLTQLQNAWGVLQGTNTATPVSTSASNPFGNFLQGLGVSTLKPLAFGGAAPAVTVNVS